MAQLKNTKKESIKLYAGFWNRFWAFYIDQVILLVVLAVIRKIFSYFAVYSVDPSILNKVEAMISLTSVLAYFSLLESSSTQATIGKRLLGIRVTDINGSRISILRGIGRTLAKVPSFFIFFIGFLMVAFTKKRQALHDILAGCLVVKYSESKLLLPALIFIMLLPIILLVVMAAIVRSNSLATFLESMFYRLSHW
jgi:uncharacterized RDD family membrane protein YckC